MRNKFIFPKLLIAGVMVSSSLTIAEEDSHEAHGAHEHGRAKMMLVAEDQQLSIQLESPAINIVGFEHEANTKEQYKQVLEATGTLAKPEALFVINGGQCQFIKANVENPFSEHDEHEKHGHEEHDKHEDHDDHHHKDHVEESEHREFLVEYNARCQASEKIEQIDVKLMSIFSGIVELDVQYIHANKQGATSLNVSNTVLHFQ